MDETPLITGRQAAGTPTEHFAALDGDAADAAQFVPAARRRRTPPALPWLDEGTLRAHFVPLARQAPWAREPGAVADRAEALAPLLRVHPRQPPATVQGVLEVCHAAARVLAALTGLDRFTLQPRTLEAAERAGLRLVQARWAREDPARTELAAPEGSSALATAEVLGLLPRPVPRTPEEDVDLDALLSAVGERTAAVVLPWLTPSGAFERHLAAAAKVAETYGALVGVDARGLGALAGRTRLREAGVDLAWLPLAELCRGASSAALGVRAPLTEFLPGPLVASGRGGFELDDDLPHSIGPLALTPAQALDALAVYIQASMLGEAGLRARAERRALDACALAGAPPKPYAGEVRRPRLGRPTRG